MPQEPSSTSSIRLSDEVTILLQQARSRLRQARFLSGERGDPPAHRDAVTVALDRVQDALDAREQAL